MDAQEAHTYLGALRTFFSMLREFKDVVVWLAAVAGGLGLIFGTPKIVVKDHQLLRERHGLPEILWTQVQAYIERSGIFKGIQDELAQLRSSTDKLRERVDQQDSTISWQTRVLVTIAQVLRVDVRTLLPPAAALAAVQPEQAAQADEAPASSPTVVSAIPTAIAVAAPSSVRVATTKRPQDGAPSTRRQGGNEGVKGPFKSS